MIFPDERDIGRKVIYRASHLGAMPEEGIITSFNDTCIFVRYGTQAHSKGTRREDLEWMRPYRKSDVRP